MMTKRNIYIVTTALISVFFFAIVWASSGNHTIRLEPTGSHPDASGSAVIARDHVSIQARGLNPDAVYTVWFVNTKPNKRKAGAGTTPFMFRTDAWGNGSYSAPLAASPVGKWAMLMIVLHPNGNPKDMKNMKGALKAAL